MVATPELVKRPQMQMQMQCNAACRSNRIRTARCNKTSSRQHRSTNCVDASSQWSQPSPEALALSPLKECRPCSHVLALLSTVLQSSCSNGHTHRPAMDPTLCPKDQPSGKQM